MATVRRPIPFNRFGGLRLDLPLLEVGSEQAAALLDVEQGQGLGLLQRRWGAKATTLSEAASAYGPLFRAGNNNFLTLRGSTLVILNLKLGEGGVTVEQATTAGEAAHMTAAQMGTPAASYSYIAQPAKTIKRWDGTAFSEPTATVDGVAAKAMPKGNHLAVWQDGGNRLVIGGAAAGPNGATSSKSHVWFSSPGDGTAYESTAYVQLSPGDGEDISDVVAWGGMIFVFKSTRLFVFYGVSTDEEGRPVFNYRTVELGTVKGGNGGALSGPKAVAGPDGVYFAARDGIYLTNGQQPALVSGALSPLADAERGIVGPAKAIFDEPLEEGGFGNFLRFNLSGTMFYARRRLFIIINSPNQTHLLLVFDLERSCWLVWKACMNAGCEGSTGQVYFTGKSKKHLYQFVETEESDGSLPAGVSMSPYWHSGAYDLGSQDEKDLVEAKIMGTGTVTLSSFKDLQPTAGFSKSVVMSEGQGRSRNSQTATMFSHKIELAGAAQVQRLIRYIRETRVATTRTGTK